MLVRKTVTVLFSDVVTSSAYGERFDPESWRRLMSRYFDEMKAVIERHGGTVEKFIGDAVMAVFGVPVIHEDDALRAVRAAAEMRDRLAELNHEFDETWGVRLEMRIGVNTGEVVAGDPATGSTFVTGDAVNLGKRLEQAAGPGEILIGKATYPLVKDAVSAGPLESISVKGKSQPVAPFRLDHVDAGAAGLARRLDTPLVDREHELRHLEHAFERVEAETSCLLVTVLGAAGIGKSRLTGELLASLGDRATALSGRCLPYGDGITFWPLAQMLRELDFGAVLAGVDDADAIAERVRATIGATEAGPGAEETFWAMRRLFEALARPRPLVLCLEDIHWAQPTLLDLIEYLSGWIRDAPVLLLCLARPDLLEIRASWGTPRPNAILLPLERLSGPDSEALLETLAGETRLSERARAQIAGAAEGNPLFVEQMVAMVAEEGSAADVIAVPPSIQALLAERLDRLGSDERAVIERAAVIGKEFPRGAIVDLVPASLRDAVGRHLLALVRKDFLEPDAAHFAHEDGFRFRHSLIRDAAYDGIPKEVRADLHARFADWMERNSGDRATELEEIRGYHLEQAFRLREELWPIDETARELAGAAAELLGSAGRRAFARGDMPAAIRLIDRAIALLRNEDAAGLTLLPELGTALKESGELARAEEILTRASADAAAAGERRVELRALIERAALRLLSDPEGQTEGLLELVEGAIPTLTDLGDDHTLATAWYLIGLTRGLWHGRFAAGEEALERALEHSRAARDRRQEAAIVLQLGFAAVSGPTPVPTAIIRCQALLADAKGHPLVEAGVLRWLSTLEAKRGNFDEARELIRRAHAVYDELGMRLTAVVASTFACGHLELLAGDHAAAARQLRAGFDALEEMGEKGYLSSVAAVLASALYGQGRYEDAYRFTEISQAAAASDDIASQIQFRATRAKLLAQRDANEEADELAQEAVSLAETTDALDMHGDVLMDLAAVHQLGGQSEDAADCVRRALRLYERKGNLVSAERARAVLGAAVGV